MTDHVHLFARRIAELEQLLSAHMASGSLDEGNAASFDAIIDAWLDEELMQIAQAHDDEATAKLLAAERRTASETAAEVARNDKVAREKAADAQRQVLLAERQRARKAVQDAQRARRQERVMATSGRVAAAAAQLDRARRLLLEANSSAKAELAESGARAGNYVTDEQAPSNIQTSEKVA